VQCGIELPYRCSYAVHGVMPLQKLLQKPTNIPAITLIKKGLPGEAALLPNIYFYISLLSKIDTCEIS
jgi:hypothetical protein